MTDLPVIMTASSIQALRADAKTQTRRLPHAWLRWSGGDGKTHPFTRELWAQASAGVEDLRRVEFEPGRYLFRWTSDPLPHQRGNRPVWIAYPTVQPGDRLWVRESFQYVEAYDGTGVAYRADGEIREIERDDADSPTGIGRVIKDFHDEPWRASMFMPRWASRLTLTVTDFRVERLQDITEADAEAEGVALPIGQDGTPLVEISAACSPLRYVEPRGPGETADDVLKRAWTYRAHYASLWEQLHGAGAWAKNPEVVAITFTVAKRNIDAREGA